MNFAPIYLSPAVIKLAIGEKHKPDHDSDAQAEIFDLHTTIATTAAGSRGSAVPTVIYLGSTAKIVKSAVVAEGWVSRLLSIRNSIDAKSKQALSALG